VVNGKYLDHHHKSIITSTSTETYWLWVCSIAWHSLSAFEMHADTM